MKKKINYYKITKIFSMIFLIISTFLIVGYVTFRVFHWTNIILNICDNNPDLIFNDSIVGEVDCQEWSNVNVFI